MSLILSIDDSKSVHAFLDKCTGEGHYQYIHALTPQEGLEVLSNRTAEISLVLLDWEMPDMTGPEVLVEVRKRGIQTPVIMLTSKNAPSDIQKMLECGCSEYIMKPFTPDIIVEKIQSVLGE